MVSRGTSIVVIIGTSLFISAAAWGMAPADPIITYQGRLLDAGEPVTDTADFEFWLYDEETDGNVVGSFKAFLVPIEEGLFTVDLNFGQGVFTGAPRWLEISFQLKSGGDMQTLRPRQAVRPAPYALYSYDGGGGGGSLWTQADHDIYYEAGNVGVGDTPNAAQQLWVVAGEGEDGVYSYADSSSSGNAVIGVTRKAGGTGMLGRAENGSGVNYGVHGETYSSDGYAGYFIGRGYVSGNLGVGVLNPTQKLDVHGTTKTLGLQMPTGAQDGYVLTTDPNGTASWQAASGGGSSPWAIGSHLIYYNDGDVGIGTDTPYARLHVVEPDTYAIYGQCQGEGTFGYVGGEGGGIEGYGPGLGVSGTASGNYGTGVRGTANSTTGGNHGVLGQSNSDSGQGVTGIANSETGVTAGVMGSALSIDGYGVWGHNYETSGYNRAVGVYGTTAADHGVGVKGVSTDGRGVWGLSEGSGRGVFGQSNATSGWTCGIEAYAQSPDGAALYAFNESTSGNACAIKAETYHSDAFAGYFDGRGYFSQRVGIGVQDANEMLEVAGTVKATGLRIGESATVGHVLTADASGVATWQAPAAGSEPLWSEGSGGDLYYNNGCVGIGIANPVYPLHVTSDEYNTTYFINTNPTAAAYSVYASASGTGATALYGTTSATTGTTTGVYGRSYSPSGRGVCGYNTAGGTAVYGYTGTAMGWAGFFYGRAHVSGDLGIGTQSPQAELDVNGTVRTNGFKLDSAATNGYVLTCDSSGYGTWQEIPSGGDPFTLPYEGSTSANDAGFQVTNTGTGISSSAIRAVMNNPSSHSDSAAGIFSADNSNSMGIWAYNDGSAATIRADHDGDYGVAVYGRSDGDGGGRFSTTKVDGYGVRGTASATSGLETYGGWFESSSSSGKGVYARVTGDYGTAVKAIAEGGEGVGLQAEAPWDGVVAKGGLNAAKFYGDVRVYEYGTNNQVFRVNDSTGVTSVDVLQIMGGADLAEKFDVNGTAEPGTVVEIDPDNPGKMRISSGAYNRRVAGVISGANELGVGMVLGEMPGCEEHTPVALNGRVWVKCDARQQAVQPGDMLTTSDLAGHAMAVSDFERAHGAVIGKAMSALPQGETGMVLVLVNLQ